MGRRHLRRPLDSRLTCGNRRGNHGRSTDRKLLNLNTLRESGHSRGLHSTDPFIFGARFLYSHCGQASKRGLRDLGQGSVIAFGSGRVIDNVPRWMLDTVLVVRDFKDYIAADARMALNDWVPATFLDVTGGPLTDNGREVPPSGTCAAPPARLRIYRGATPDDPIQGMFSFVPAIPAGRNSGFPRPLVDLPGDYFNARNFRAPMGQSRSRRPDELRNLWKRLVKQVRDAGLVLGTRADLPARREARSAKEGDNADDRIRVVVSGVAGGRGDRGGARPWSASADGGGSGRRTIRC